MRAQYCCDEAQQVDGQTRLCMAPERQFAVTSSGCWRCQPLACHAVAAPSPSPKPVFRCGCVEMCVDMCGDSCCMASLFCTLHQPCYHTATKATCLFFSLWTSRGCQAPARRACQASERTQSAQQHPAMPSRGHGLARVGSTTNMMQQLPS